VRATKPLAEEAYYLYVLDGQNRLQGIVNLRQLVEQIPQVGVAGEGKRIELVRSGESHRGNPVRDGEIVKMIERHQIATGRA